MRPRALSRAILILGIALKALPATAPIGAASAAISFDRDVAPIVKRCQPCHFPGGKMYDRLPFDRAETIRVLGPKLFTRIKDEKERVVIRRFLATLANEKP